MNALGFTFDWGNDQSGIAGISQGDCRLFLTSAQFRGQYGATGAVVVWLNLESKQEVEELCERWKESGARILAEPEDKPWGLHEFRAADLDGKSTARVL